MYTVLDEGLVRAALIDIDVPASPELVAKEGAEMQAPRKLPDPGQGSNRTTIRGAIGVTSGATEPAAELAQERNPTGREVWG